MKKQFHLIIDSSLQRMRRPYISGKYDPQTQFLPREVSDFLEYYMPGNYAQITVDDPETAEKLLSYGFDDGNQRWEVFTGAVRERVKLILVPAGSMKSDDLSLIGIHSHLKDLASATKFSKRLNRLTAPVEYSTKGYVVELKDEILDVILQNGEHIKVRFAPVSPLTDGMSLFSPRGAQLLAGIAEPRLGDSLRITCASPAGLVKGHGLIWSGLDYDAIFYGASDVLTFDGFYFGSMGKLHVRQPYLDVQSFINYLSTGGEVLAEKQAQRFFHEVMEASQDERKLRRTFLKFAPDPNSEDYHEDETWILQTALEKGLSFRKFPGLFRKIYRFLLHRVLDCERGRIPLHGIAEYGYVMPEPFIFDRQGNVNLKKSRLRGNSVFTPKIPGNMEIVMYRQPNGNPEERYVAQTTEAQGFKRLGDGQVVFLGAEIAEALLKKLGGGDFDDAVVMVHNPDWVKHFKSLPVYPLQIGIDIKATTKKDVNQYLPKLGSFDPSKYTRRHLFAQIEEVKQGNTGIGTIVNGIMLDTLVTQGKASMIADLEGRLMEEKEKDAKSFTYRRLEHCIKWLHNRPDYQLSGLASNLEYYIDAIKRDGAGVGDAGGLIKALWQSTLVVPDSFTRGGFQGRGRVPATIRAEYDPLSAKTPMCYALERIAQERDSLEQAFREMEWLAVTPPPEELITYFPQDKEIRNMVKELRTWWYEEWQKTREKGISDDDRRNAFKRLEAEVSKELMKWSPDIQMELAVEVYKQVYKSCYVPGDPRMLDMDSLEMKKRTFSDGLVWTAPIGHRLINAFEQAGLTGSWVLVDLEPQYGRLIDGDVKVNLKATLVMRKSDNAVIGLCNAPDGEYLMQGGLIALRAAHPALTSIPNDEDKELILAELESDYGEKGGEEYNNQDWDSESYIS